MNELALGERVSARRRATLARTRRFAMVGAALGAVVLLLGTAVTFTATNASVPVSISSGGSAAVQVSTGLDLAFGTNDDDPDKWAISGTGTATSPSWSPVVGQPTATNAGDLILVDTRGASTTTTVTVALQNAATLANGYSTFILPVQVRSGTVAGGAVTWGNEAAPGGGTQYLTLSAPVATFTLQPNALYEVLVPGDDEAGVVVAQAQTDLTPRFLIQAN